MKQKDVIIFSVATAFIYTIGEIGYLHGDLGLYFSEIDRYWTVSGILVSYITAILTLHFIEEWQITSRKDSFFAHTLTFTIIASIISTIINYLLNEALSAGQMSTAVAFFWYVPYKYFESCFFELYRTRLCE